MWPVQFPHPQQSAGAKAISKDAAFAAFAQTAPQYNLAPIKGHSCLSSPPDPPQSASLLKDMPAARKPFRSLRSFTLAGRHSSTASEIASDPIVDDDPSPISDATNTACVYRNPSDVDVIADPETPIKQHSPPVLSIPQLRPTLRRSSRLTPLLPDSPSDNLTGANLLPFQNVDETATKPATGHHVIDLEEPSETLESPAIKRRRTLSSHAHLPPLALSPEVDALHLRQIVDNAKDEDREAILAASSSPGGRRQLHQMFVVEKHADAKGENATDTNNVKNGDVQWLGTSYDSVLEVMPTPSPPRKTRRRSRRLVRNSEIENRETKPKNATVQRIDTSESPERITRRRSRRLYRGAGRDSSNAASSQAVDNSDSSVSPSLKKRRSSRLAKPADVQPLSKSGYSNDSNLSDSSEDSAVARHVRTRRGRRGNDKAKSRPLPAPKVGGLRDRLRRRTPLLPILRKRSRNAKNRASSSFDGSNQRNKSGLRRSARIGRASSGTHQNSVVDLDSEDEVIEEGSATDEDDGYGSSYEEDEEVLVEEEEEEEEEDNEALGNGDEEDVGDEDDGDEDSSYEERAWKEQLRRKKLNHKRKRNGRRKRTKPRDAFRTEGGLLTAPEQKERLDFLVQQSADIAGHLHKAMADASRNAVPSDSTKPGQSNAVLEDRDQKAKRDGSHKDSSKSVDHDTEANCHEEGNHVIRKEESFVIPSGAGCELQAHQKEGVDWLLALDAQGLNMILADEMGLGKTIQAVSFLASLVLSGNRGPHLVIAPKNVVAHWANEVRKWYPTELTVVTHLGSAEDRLEELKNVLEEDSFDILVTSYDHALRDLLTKKRNEGLSWEHVQVLRAFRKVEFEYLIVDEAQRLKNDSSKLNIGIRAYSCAQRRLLLTGTPLSNNLRELWSLMNVLNPRIFSSKATFEAWFSAPFASKTKKHAKVSLTHAEQSVIVDRLHTIIRPFFRRRVRADVCPEFTSADEVVIRCPLSALQKAVMLHLQRRATTYEAGMNNIIMAMRAASNHPFTVSSALFDGDHNLSVARLTGSSGKFVFLYFALPRLIESGHRVLIFSQFKRVLDFVEDLMSMLNLKFGRLDGDTSNDDRTDALVDFNYEGSDIPVFLLTTRAGGVGLNLQSADTVILFDSDWNPSADLQAVSRIQRIGQKRTVHILRLVSENSVDDLIVETARQKLRTQNVAVGAGKFNTSLGAALDSRMRQKDLEDLLKKLEVQNFTEDAEPASQGPCQENVSPKSISPDRSSHTARDRRFEVWSKQLLRKGETSLSSVSLAPMWIDEPADSADRGIPHWLGQDADLQSAAKALRCSDAGSARYAYEKSLLMKAESGAHSKRDRATRARRQVKVLDISDVDSESGREQSIDDPSVNPDNYSAPNSEDEILIVEEPKRTAGRKKTASKGLTFGWSGTQEFSAPTTFTSTVPITTGTQAGNVSNPIPTPLAGRPRVGIDSATKARLHDSFDPPTVFKEASPPAEPMQVWGLPSPYAALPNALNQPHFPPPESTLAPSSSWGLPDVVVSNSAAPDTHSGKLSKSPGKNRGVQKNNPQC